MEESTVLPDSWSLSLFPDILPDPNSSLPDLAIWTSSLMFPVSPVFPNNQKRSGVSDEVRQVFSCEKCGQIFQHLKSLKRHEASNTSCSKKPAPTLWDSEQFSRTLTSNSSELVEGKEKGENLDDTCSVCRENFSSSDKLLIHMEEHFSRLCCCQCKKRFGSQNKLSTHHRSHTKQRPFACRFCEKRFTELSSLRKHTLTHGPPHHQCHRCEKAFVRKDYLKKHLNSAVCLKLIE